MNTSSFNDLRVWAVFDHLIGRIEYLSESYSDCCRVKHLYEKSPCRRSIEVLRFDLCPLYHRDKPAVTTTTTTKSNKGK